MALSGCSRGCTNGRAQPRHVAMPRLAGPFRQHMKNSSILTCLKHTTHQLLWMSLAAGCALASPLPSDACFVQAQDGRPWVMAYRGASALHPEHSLGAYRVAIEQGARFIECDVVLTHDLVPVCRHEPDISQTTDVLARLRAGEAFEYLPKPAPATTSNSSSSDAGGAARVQEGQDQAVWAADLTFAQLKRLRAVFPGSTQGSAPAGSMQGSAPDGTGRNEEQRAAATADSRCGDGAVGAGEANGHSKGAEEDPCASRKGDAGMSGSCSNADLGVKGGGGAGEEGADGAVAGGRAGRVCSWGPVGGAEDGGDDGRVASLEELLQMATAAVRPVGVALHIQASAWHAQHLAPQLAAAGTTFEDLLLATLQRYGYATAPHGSSEWAQRPSYIMAFEARSLQYLANRTTSPLTQVLSPVIPDTGETWASATSPQGLARIRTYASSVAVARQELLREVHDIDMGLGRSDPRDGGHGGREAGAAQAAGGDGGGGRLEAATELLERFRAAGLQVFASVFKPAPAHLLPAASSWEHELAPLLLGPPCSAGGDAGDVAGTGCHPSGGGEDGQGEEQRLNAGGLLAGGGPGAVGGAGGVGGARHCAWLDGVFTDSPLELHRAMARMRCPGGGGEGDGGSF